MPGFAAQTLGVGNQPPLDFFVPDTTARCTPGTVLWADDPYLGSAAFVYAKLAAAYTVGIGATFGNANGDVVATAVPNTAGQGFPVGFLRQGGAINTYGWWQVFGVCPIKVGASVAAAANIGVTAAGSFGAVSAGKQLLNAQVLVASTGTVTKTIQTSLAQTKTILCSNTDGLWVGQAVTGTGVGASAVILTINPNKREITVDVDSTAAGTVTGTFTYTGWVLARVAFPFMQGQIT